MECDEGEGVEMIKGLTLDVELSILVRDLVRIANKLNVNVLESVVETYPLVIRISPATLDQILNSLTLPKY